jgi:recombination DNA repair RAD52 pathway protein
MDTKESRPRSEPHLPIKLSDAVKAIKDCVANGHWQWYRNNRCKYITLRVDMRTGNVFMTNRDGKEIDVQTLYEQHNVIEKTKEEFYL